MAEDTTVVGKVIADAEGVCLMCAEEDPTRCHQKWLIARDPADYKNKVRHIRAGFR